MGTLILCVVCLAVGRYAPYPLAEKEKQFKAWLESKL